MLTLGVDPDTKAPGLALGTKSCIHKVATPTLAGQGYQCSSMRLNVEAFVDGRIYGRIPPFVRLAVEGQEIYSTGTANANNLIQVAMIAGAALSASGFSTRYNPAPKKWKGQRPKGVDQKATLEHYGWKFRDNGRDKSPTLLEVPTGVEVLGDIVDWSEVFDAMGLVWWGSRQV